MAPLQWNHTARAMYDDRQSTVRARTVWFDEATVGVHSTFRGRFQYTSPRPDMHNIFEVVFQGFVKSRGTP